MDRKTPYGSVRERPNMKEGPKFTGRVTCIVVGVGGNVAQVTIVFSEGSCPLVHCVEGKHR